MSDIKSGIQYMFQTRNIMTLAVSGTGHTAMECAIFNAVEAGESVLTAVNGIWGERAAEMAERIGKTWCSFSTINVVKILSTMRLLDHTTQFTQGRTTTPKLAFLPHSSSECEILYLSFFLYLLLIRNALVNLNLYLQ